MQVQLPLHPSMRHPLTGEPLRALYVDKHGHARYPIMGGAPDDPADPPKDPAPSDPPKTDPPADPPKDPAPADPPKEPGFPANTPLAEMTVEQREAYWKHQSRKHESNWKGLVGDRDVNDVRNDLAEMERIRQEKLTPSEKAIQEAEQRGREAASSESLQKAAKAILRAQLQARGKSEEDINDLMGPVNVTAFITDGDVDTDRLSEFAGKIAPAADTGEGGGRHDYGGGRRGGRTSSSVATGAERYQERHGKKTVAP